MKKLYFASLLFLLLICLGLFGCGGSGHPSEAAGRKVFENEQKGALSHGAEIVSFHQINGQTAEEHGIKMYGMEYEAEVKYPASPYRPAGETRKDKGVLRFEQTEKGWKAQDGEVY